MSKPEPHHAKQPSDTPATQAAPATGGKSAEAELERWRREAAQAKDQCLRTLAEFENAKKRLHREKEEFARYAAEAVVRELLPIVDSLDQALVAQDSAPQTAQAAGGLHQQPDPQAMLKGIQLIRQQLLKLLEKEGVKRIPTVGEPFDPHRHEALAQVEASDGAADGTVVEEVQVGYTLHNRVIRPAMVKVAKQSAISNQQSADSSQQHTETKHEGRD